MSWVLSPSFPHACARDPYPTAPIIRSHSVRAYRASVRNEVYAADAAEQKAKREKEEAEKREKDKINPFSVCFFRIVYDR